MSNNILDYDITEVKDSEYANATKRDEGISQYLAFFMDELHTSGWPRSFCCGTSRSLYCPECYRILISPSDNRLPDCLREKISSATQLTLPFALDIILHDRRPSATGLHAKVLLDESARNNIKPVLSMLSTTEILEKVEKMNSIPELRRNFIANHKFQNLAQTIGLGWPRESTEVVVIDHEAGEKIPVYSGQEGIYLLFPSPGESIPISSVTGRIEKLVVLDCKWTRTSSRLHESLRDLPKVHLTKPPIESFSWRWHDAGKGMVTTIEAVYCSAWEIFQYYIQKWESEFQNIDLAEEIVDGMKWNEIMAILAVKQGNLMHLLIFFAIQRARSAIKAQSEGKLCPFTTEGKEAKRSERRCIGTTKHAADLQKGKVLKEQYRKGVRNEDYNRS